MQISPRRAAAVLVALVPLAASAVPARAAGVGQPMAGIGQSVAVSARAARPLAGLVIGLDPGHNGRDDPAVLNRLVPAGFGERKACNTIGTQTNAGYTEHAHNWDVATRVRRELVALGATVVLTRTSDTGLGPCVDVRAAILARAHPQVTISIHADGDLAPGARGFHVIYGTRAVGGVRVVTASRRLAVVMRNAFATTGLPRSTYVGHGTALSPRSDLAGTNLATVPTVMLEAGNMRSSADAALLTSPAFRQREADAIVRGIRTWTHR